MLFFIRSAQALSLQVGSRHWLVNETARAERISTTCGGQRLVHRQHQTVRADLSVCNRIDGVKMGIDRGLDKAEGHSGKLFVNKIPSSLHGFLGISEPGFFCIGELPVRLDFARRNEDNAVLAIGVCDRDAGYIGIERFTC